MTSYESLDRDSEDGAGIRLYIGTYEGHRNEKYERHGFGHALLPNGDEYVGEYVNGKRHGRGKYVFFSKQARYEGQYVNNQRHGQGTFWYPDGSVYDGDWTEGQRNGYGVYIYANGDKYLGMWKEDRRHGQGEYIYKDYRLKYKGNWTNGRFEDEGTIVTPNYSYSGTFSGEEPVGPGRFHFDTGCEQEGEYVIKRIVRRTSTMREVVHVPVWRCLMLYDAGPRKTTLNS